MIRKTIAVSSGSLALGFVAANAMGWAAYLAVVVTRGAVPILAVPVVFGIANAWAAGRLDRSMAVRIGFGGTTTLWLLGTVFALVGTQGMSGRESILALLPMAFQSAMLAALVSAVGFLPVSVRYGGRAWAWAVGGFTAGAGAGAVLSLGAMLSLFFAIAPIGFLFAPPFGAPMWLPPVVAALAVRHSTSRD